MLDGSLTLNADAFYYNYSNYQISEIVDRTAINNNYDAHVEGGELEASWEPLPGLKLGLAQGIENGVLDKGDRGIDPVDPYRRNGGVDGRKAIRDHLFGLPFCRPMSSLLRNPEEGSTGFPPLQRRLRAGRRSDHGRVI